MDSMQLRRENKTDEREIHVEKDKVPKITSHFESLTVKDSGDHPVAQHVIKTMHGAGGIKDQSEVQGTQGQKQQGPSLEEISKYRGVAQQNSMEAIRAAEEQYLKSKEIAAQQTGEQVSDVRTGQQTKESLSSAAQTAAEKAETAKEYTVEKGQQTGEQANESLSSVSQTAMEKAAMAKNYTLEKSGQAKDVVAEKTTGLTSTVVDVSKKGASYVGEKAVAAKDIALETGKTTVGYVGKVAEVVKDKAVVAGWTAAEFASDKAVGATETVANVSSTVAGFAGDTVVATKDVIVGVGKKTVDMVVATEESAKDYAARKKAEKQRELEAKNSKGEGEWVGEKQDRGFEHQEGGGFVEEGDFEHGGGGGFVEEGDFGHGGGTAAGGVMRVIGETLVEIGRNTKDMVVGQGGYEGEQSW